MADLFDSSPIDGDKAKDVDPELLEFLMIEKQNAQLNAQVIY